MSSRTTLAVILIGLIGGIFMPAALAETDTKNAARIAGQLSKVDGKKLTIASTEGQEIVITCVEATKFSRDGDKSVVQAKLEDLQAGQQVRAYYSKTDNSALAVIIAKQNSYKK